MSSGRVRVYIASSLDGFIAGPEDDLSWLPGADGVAGEGGDPKALSFDDFLGAVGALLMGRRTHDVVAGFAGPWPYGERPVLVATHRPLDAPASEWIRPVTGSINTLIDQARAAAGEGDVYLDGGALIRQALDAGLVDELIVTLAPIALGRGIPLFAGLNQPRPMAILEHRRFDHGMVQLRLRPSE